MEKTLDRNQLESMLLVDLQGLAREMGLTGITGMRKQELIDSILNRKVEEDGLFLRTGILDVLPEGYGFLRTRGYLPSEDDIYVSMSQIRLPMMRQQLRNAPIDSWSFLAGAKSCYDSR